MEVRETEVVRVARIKELVKKKKKKKKVKSIKAFHKSTHLVQHKKYGFSSGFIAPRPSYRVSEAQKENSRPVA